jgi:hypothetical protein
MKTITSHRDGYALNESIEITAEGEPASGEKGAGGAHHLFVCRIAGKEVARIQFQEGPRNEAGSTPGITHAALLAIAADTLIDFQSGPFSSREGALALTHIQEAMHWIRARADDRNARGVLGFTKK